MMRLPGRTVLHQWDVDEDEVRDLIGGPLEPAAELAPFVATTADLPTAAEEAETGGPAGHGGRDGESHGDAGRVASLGRVLAYKVLFDVLRTPAVDWKGWLRDRLPSRRRPAALRAKSWKIFYLFTEALRQMRRYSVDPSNGAVRERALHLSGRIVGELDYRDLQARFNKGVLHLSRGDSAEAVAEFSKIIDHIMAEPLA